METPEFDIFRLNVDGSVGWIACANTMNEAMLHVKRQIALEDLSYIIMNSVTGKKTVVSP